MRIFGTCFSAILLVLTAGCNRHKEDVYHHAIHVGETAKIAEAEGQVRYAGVTRDDSHTVAQWVASRNAPEIEKMIAAGTAIRLDAGTEVKVLSESYNEREIRILTGAAQGKVGWVPFEWLRPRQKDEL